MSQPNYMEKMQEEFAQHMEPIKSDPAEPFPVKTFLAPLDNCGKPVMSSVKFMSRALRD